MKWIILGFAVILILNAILVSNFSYRHGYINGQNDEGNCVVVNIISSRRGDTNCEMSIEYHDDIIGAALNIKLNDTGWLKRVCYWEDIDEFEEPEGEIGTDGLDVSYKLSYSDCKEACSDSECMGFCLNMGELKEGEEKCLYNDDGSERICFGRIIMEIGEVRRIE